MTEEPGKVSYYSETTCVTRGISTLESLALKGHTTTRTGEYKGEGEGVWDGKGKLTKPDGTVYEGDFSDGQMSGQAFLFANGNSYEGGFIQGKREGFGSTSTGKERDMRESR